MRKAREVIGSIASRTSGSFRNCRSPSRNKFCKTTLLSVAQYLIETTNVRRRREVTAVWSVAQHRRCVADLATSQPYLYEELGGKADTMEAKHQRHIPHKTSHPSRHRIVIVFTEIEKERAGVFATAARLPETNSVKTTNPNLNK